MHVSQKKKKKQKKKKLKNKEKSREKIETGPRRCFFDFPFLFLTTVGEMLLPSVNTGMIVVLVALDQQHVITHNKALIHHIINTIYIEVLTACQPEFTSTPAVKSVICCFIADNCSCCMF